MSRSILIIEDHADLRSAITKLLSRNHYVCESVDSDGAIAKLASKHYETILLAPRLSIVGDPVLQYLTVNQPSELEHVVLMTNPVGDEEAADERVHVLAKPFSSEQLLAKVR